MKKRVLIFSAFPPNRNSGGQYFTLRMLEDLGKRYDVDLICFSFKNHMSMIAYPKVNSIKVIRHTRIRKILNAILVPFVFPIFTVRFSIFTLMKLRQIRKNYDFILFNCSQVFLYPFLLRKNPNDVFVCQDVMAEKFSRDRGSGAFMQFWARMSEKIIMKSLQGRVFCFSTKDRIHLSKYNVKAQVIDFYLDDRILPQMTFSPLQFCFLANWERKENLQGLFWFLERVYPRLPKEFIFMVIGRMTDAKMTRFAAGLPSVRLLGFVDNPYEILSSSMCLIAPLFSGAGVKVKVVEALACGVPVIGTRIAFEGIEWMDRRFMIPAENESEFVTRICEANFAISDRMKLYRDFHESYGKNLLGTLLSEKG